MHDLFLRRQSTIPSRRLPGSASSLSADKASMKTCHGRQRLRSLVLAVAMVALVSWLGCARSPRPSSEDFLTAQSSARRSVGSAAAGFARSMVGAPYRYGGSTPSGFDCSGLVIYSFARAGRPGLPHSVTRLDDLTRRVPIEALEVGDLLFFRLRGRKNSHVGIYIGERRFVHAPSSGKAVEIVSFDHVYWGPRIQLAGRLTD